MASMAYVPQASPAEPKPYPDVGPTPTPMWGTTFRYQDPLSGAVFNDDGTNSNNPTVDAGTQTLGGVTYLLRKLRDSATAAITFKGQQYTVYSVVPQNMTIDYAYKHASQYYDPKSLVDHDGTTPLIDFTIPTTINNGNSTAKAANQPPNAPLASDQGKTGEAVYLTKPPTDPNSLFFIANFPNTSGGHAGLTANIYFVIDPFLGKPGYWPDSTHWPNGSFHLTPYGWALDPRTVASAYTLQLLEKSGGDPKAKKILFEATAILKNLWKHTLQGFDMISTNNSSDKNYYTKPRDLLQPLFDAIKAYGNYPFPGKKPASGNYPVWLTEGGLYLHVQPQPGFQRNLLRYYTAWGGYDLYNQASDLFVRKDGTIELPAIHTPSGWRYAPIVTQTWDGSQRYTVLNLTTGTVPSTYDDYPGAEYYLPGNVYLPGKAGVVTAYVDYKVYGDQGLTSRQTDLWLGLKGDTVKDILFWGDAPVYNPKTKKQEQTEPGGQANKPYMFGADSHKLGNTWHHAFRLQSSNSFCIARLSEADLKNKLYDASLWVKLNDGKDYQRAATISYQWQKWTIDAHGNWVASGDALGAGVPQLTYANTLNNLVTIQAWKTYKWHDDIRNMEYGYAENVNPANLKNYASVLKGPLREYFATADVTDPKVKFLIVLNEAQRWAGGSGDWGTAANWNNGVVPGDFNNVYLQQDDAVNRTVTYNNTAGSAPSLAMVRLDASGPGTMTLKLDSGGSGGDLQAQTLIVGAGNQGHLHQTAGTLTVEQLFLGYESTGNGTYTLEGGTLVTNNTHLGVYGASTFNQTGGTHIVTETLHLAANPGSSATYNLSGGSHAAGTINLNTGGIFNQTGGTLDFTTFNHSGGTATFSGVDFSLDPGQTYNLNGGSLTADSLNINDGGAFTQTGGTLNYNSLNLRGGGFTGDLENTGLLTGTGPITGNVMNAGTVNPGNSPGTLNIVGSYTQTAAGTHTVEVASPASYDVINVTGAPGTATLAGTVAPTLLGGYRPRGNQVFPGIITTTGGVSGTFNSIANQQITPTLFWQARYHPASVDLWVERNYTNQGLGLNTNQAAVGAMLNGVSGVTTGDLDTVLNTIDYLPDSASVRNAFKEISPEKAVALTTLAFAGANLQKRVLSRRITDLRFGNREAGVLGGFPGSFNLNYSRGEGLMLAYNSSSLAGLITGAKREARHEGRWGLYLEPNLILGSQVTTANQTGFDFLIAGFTLGADYRVRDNLLIGLATGYSHTGADFKGSGGSVENNTWPILGYAAFLPESFYVFGSLGYSLNLFNLERGITFGGLNRKAKSSPTGDQFNAYAEAGYDLRLGRLLATPVMSLAYSRLWLDSFSESGAGALNLKVSSQQATSLQTGVGAKVALPLKRNSTLIVPQVYATWQHEYSDNSRGLDARLSQAGNTFTFQTDSPHRNFAVVGANVNILTQKNLQVQLDYNAEVGRGNYTAHYVSAGVRWQF